MLRGLLITNSIISMMTVPDLLVRAGFRVDCLSLTRAKKHRNVVSDFIYTTNIAEFLEAATRKVGERYDLIVIGEDDLLQTVLNSSLSDDLKLELLPILETKNFRHLYSKIGLSNILEESGVNTPEFRVANGRDDLKKLSEEIGYPVIVKIDSSGGGSGVYECSDGDDIDHLSGELKDYPVLIQKKIDGALLDLSGFYQEGHLIHFSYSYPERFFGYKFSPQPVRNYLQLASVEKIVFDELDRLGKALGAHGFANISCIHSDQDQKLYFIEADMRPNAWINFPRYFGDDSAIRIANYFTSGQVLEYPCKIDKRFPEKTILPLFLRLNLWEIILNRYGVWRYIPERSTIARYFIFKKARDLISSIFR